jgi:protein gp37
MPVWPPAHPLALIVGGHVRRTDHLRAAPVGARFLSLEPLLGPLPSLDLSGIGWVIVGGERSGLAAG